MADPDKFASATVVQRRDLSEDLWVIRMRSDCALSFRPGQYVTLGLQVDGRMVERPYSIVSAPHEEEVELFFELVPEGALTPALHGLLVGGEMVMRRRTKGLFLRNTPVPGRSHLFVATVTGIAPFVSLLRSLCETWQQGEWDDATRITLLVGASRSHEFGYLDEVRALEARLPWLRVVPTVSRPWEDPEWPGETGRVEDVLRKHADAAGVEPGRASVYLCGHPGMIAGARAIMRRRGLPDTDIFEEQYWPEGKTPA